MSESQPSQKDWHVVLVAVPGCMATAVLGSLEAFTIANLLGGAKGPSLTFEVASPSNETVLGFGGLPIPISSALSDISRVDAVVIPPIVGDPSDLASTHHEFVNWLSEIPTEHTIKAATCTGTFLLAETGALNGRRATTTPAFRDLFQERYPEVLLRPSLRVVDEGTLMTAGATTSYLDLALALVSRILGPRVALDSARFLSVDANPRSQQPFTLPRPALDHRDEEIRKAERWIAENLTETSDTASLARVAGLGQRTFARRFRSATGESPREYRQRVRVEAALKDLEATNLSIEEITNQCGYEDTRSFRRLFHREMGISPGEYRKRFGHGDTGS